MAEVRVPADPAMRVKDFLASEVPLLVSGSAPTVGLVLPEAWTPKSVPHVVVFDDGGPARWPILTAPRVRVTVWAGGRTRARELAALCMGVLMARKVPGVAHVWDPSTVLDARDDHNGGVMASFTVQAKARTRPL